LPATPELQALVTLALMIDAFILGATWQLLSDPVKRKSILKRFSKSTPDQKMGSKEIENLV
jgi:hypothetical protein